MRPKGCAAALRCQEVFPAVLRSESAAKGSTVLIGNIDHSNSLAVNFNFLFSVTAAPVGCVDYHFVNQIVRRFRCQLFRIGALAHIFQKLPKGVLCPLAAGDQLL